MVRKGVENMGDGLAILDGMSGDIEPIDPSFHRVVCPGKFFFCWKLIPEDVSEVMIVY